MLFKTLLLSLYAVFAVAKSSCKDDSSFTWINEWDNNEYELSCAFLTNSSKEKQNLKRQGNWCHKKVDGYWVKDKCKYTCDNCDEDKQDEDYDCEDKPKKWEDSEGRKCKWYAKDSKKRCKKAKDYKNDKKDAKDVCCACGGGKDEFLVSSLDTSTSVDELKFDLQVEKKNKCEEKCCDTPTWWEDSEGNDCDWYAKKDKNCKNAKDYKNDGYTAKDVCCACGGGEEGEGYDKYDYDDDYDDDYDECYDRFSWWEDSEGNDCEWYAKKDKNCKHADYYENDGFTAEDVCCACDGGMSDDYDCKDKPKDFEDSEGNDCDWYAKKDKRCRFAEDYENDDGMTAKDACCACGGGKEKYFTAFSAGVTASA